MGLFVEDERCRCTIEDIDAPSIYIICPDDPKPGGGQRKLYRHVDVLNAHGYRAWIVHATPGLRLTWFENTTPVTYMGAPIPPGAILGVPEMLGPQIPSIAGNARKVIINQNAYYTFFEYPSDPREPAKAVYLDPRVVATITVSEDSQRYLEYAFPGATVLRVRNSIDTALFYPSSEKKNRIAYMPRKNLLDAQQVLRILLHRGVLNGWEVVAIENRSEAEAAAILRESRLFLSFGSPEGFGLPPAEAMACGCVTIGYHGQGGREYFTSEHGFPIELGDIVGYAKTVESVLMQLNRDAGALDAMTSRASEFVRSTYSPANEERDIVDCWRRIIEMAG